MKSKYTIAYGTASKAPYLIYPCKTKALLLKHNRVVPDQRSGCGEIQSIGGTSLTEPKPFTFNVIPLENIPIFKDELRKILEDMANG